MCAHECSMQFYAWLYSTRGYIPRVAIFHAWRYSTRGHIPRVHGYIPRVGLHETCMLHAIRKCGPRKHVTGFIGFHAWKRVEGTVCM